MFERIEQIPQKGITVDLLYLEGCDDQKEIVTFEIKAGGNLDTKNCKSNADEVLSLLNSIYIQKKNRERKSGRICGEGW